MIQAQIKAPRDAVWAVYTDHRGWVNWAGVKEVVLRQQGDPAPNGVGARRVVRASGIAVEEEIVAFEPPKRMVYRIVGGIPIVNHEACVQFEETPEGTHLIWNVRFDPLIPLTGGLMARLMKAGLQQILDRFAACDFESLARSTPG